MIIYVVYRFPADAPDKFVLRRWTIFPNYRIPDPDPLLVSCCLEQVRRAVPPGHFQHPRSEQDLRAVFEQWIPKKYEKAFKQELRFH